MFERIILFLIPIALRTSDWLGITTVVSMFCMSFNISPLINKCKPIKIRSSDSYCAANQRYEVSVTRPVWEKHNKKWRVEYETIEKFGAECVYVINKTRLRLVGAYYIRQGKPIGIEYDIPIELPLAQSQVCKY